MRELFPGAETAADAEQLAAAGVVRVFTDDDGADDQSGLRGWLEFLQPGDTVMVTSAAVLASTVPRFVSMVAELSARGIGFRSLAEPALSTGGAVDPADVFVALSSLRRRLSSLRTRAGMAAAAGEGRRPGRPTVMTPERVAMAVELRAVGRPISHIARVLGVSANAVQRALVAEQGQ